MLKRLLIACGMIATLCGCSYSYDVIASMQDGHVVFSVSPKSSQQPDCLRFIEVRADGSRSAVWSESVDYEDDCENTFPVKFGAALKGRHQQDWPTEGPGALVPEVIYEVATTTGATGFGGGRFIVHANGTVENLPSPQDSVPSGS